MLRIQIPRLKLRLEGDTSVQLFEYVQNGFEINKFWLVKIGLKCEAYMYMYVRVTTHGISISVRFMVGNPSYSTIISHCNGEE